MHCHYAAAAVWLAGTAVVFNHYILCFDSGCQHVGWLWLWSQTGCSVVFQGSMITQQGIFVWYRLHIATKGRAYRQCISVNWVYRVYQSASMTCRHEYQNLFFKTNQNKCNCMYSICYKPVLNMHAGACIY